MLAIAVKATSKARPVGADATATRTARPAVDGLYDSR
jgi:hypothetical protein